jgi:uncharacterized protein YcsI (UPF0317 family)
VKSVSPAQARERFRAGLMTPTAFWAPGYAQANLVVVPREAAYDFMVFAQRNPKPCPVLDVTDPGRPVTSLAPAADLRTDLPAYRIWEHGECIAEVPDIKGCWSDDLVAFLIGCSFTFERALADAGVPIRHVEQGCNVPMFITNSQCRPAGRFSGPVVVSMRPIPPERVATAVQVTGRYPAVHGAPVHIGSPEKLGVADLAKPDFGDAVTLHDGDVPVFWACGVTPQVALAYARIPFAITHAPGHMFITDMPDESYAVAGDGGTWGIARGTDQGYT